MVSGDEQIGLLSRVFREQVLYLLVLWLAQF